MSGDARPLSWPGTKQTRITGLSYTAALGIGSVDSHSSQRGVMAAGASGRAPVLAGRIPGALAGVRVVPAAYPAVRHPHHGSRGAQPPGKGTCAWRTQSHKQQSRNEKHGAGQEHPDDEEQRAGNEEYGPPMGQRYPYEPPDRPRACDARGPRSNVPIGWADGRTPHNQVPAMRPHSHRGLLSRRKASVLLLGVYPK